MKKPYQLVYNVQLGRTKPENIVHTDTECPFCHREKLTGILATDGPIWLIENKYPVLQDTYQTVLIETEDCDAELSEYPLPYLHRLFRFAINQWELMLNDSRFASVLFYKNQGPYSGGSLRHPHMQIVGLYQVDYREKIPFTTFRGPVIAQEPGLEMNISAYPLLGFSEFNILLSDRNCLDRMAEYVQFAAHYIVNVMGSWHKSYNLFFYSFQEQIQVKVIPRYIVSPIGVGYGISQVSDPVRTQEIVEQMRQLYFAENTGACAVGKQP